MKGAIDIHVNGNDYFLKVLINNKQGTKYDLYVKSYFMGESYYRPLGKILNNKNGQFTLIRKFKTKTYDSLSLLFNDL